LLAADYGRVINALKVAIDNLNTSARDAVLGKNAIRLYKLTTAS
jgi:predicted TIM-barrel fold metal-dependent hydrolase